jgi:hypothetical protein
VTLDPATLAERTATSGRALDRARHCRRHGQLFAALELERLAAEISRGAHRNAAEKDAR